MPFNTKDPRWIQMRAERIGAKWEAGETRCNYCGQEMFFSDYEKIPSFKSRCLEPPQTKDDLKQAVATLDHIIPLSLGGPFHHMNLTVMCLRCNEEKGGRDPEDWLGELLRHGRVDLTRATKIRSKIRRTLRRMEKRGEAGRYNRNKNKRSVEITGNHSRVDDNFRPGLVSLPKEPWL